MVTVVNVFYLFGYDFGGVVTFNIFNSEEMIDLAHVKTDSCNPNGALKRLLKEAKNRR